MNIVDNDILKEKTLEFYGFQMQELIFKKLNLKKERKKLEELYKESLQEISKLESSLNQSIRIVRKKLEKEVDSGEKNDKMEE